MIPINKSYWKGFDEKDPIRIAFQEKGYIYCKPCSCHSTFFRKTIGFDNGEKYYIWWRFVNDAWETSMLAKKPNGSFDFVPMDVTSLDNEDILKQKCADHYKNGDYIPFYTYKNLENC